MKRLIILILAVIVLLIFSSIALGQQEKSKQIKSKPSVKENADSKSIIQKPEKPVQNVKSKQEGIFGPGEWNTKSKKPLDGKGTDIVKPENDPVLIGGWDSYKQNNAKQADKNRLSNPAASGKPSGKRQVTGNQQGVNKVSPDVIDPNKANYQDGDDHLRVDKNKINRVSPDVIDPAKQNRNKVEKPAEIKMKEKTKSSASKEKK